mmetsp:Transcript_52484/g.139248  ORF Transcript_52484/g.139248 Transcript_52484/m.139248 type:complete len:264 (-) Transcript_52484:3-794(-)
MEAKNWTGNAARKPRGGDLQLLRTLGDRQALRNFISRYRKRDGHTSLRVDNNREVSHGRFTPALDASHQRPEVLSEPLGPRGHDVKRLGTFLAVEHLALDGGVEMLRDLIRRQVHQAETEVPSLTVINRQVEEIEVTIEAHLHPHRIQLRLSPGLWDILHNQRGPLPRRLRQHAGQHLPRGSSNHLFAQHGHLGGARRRCRRRARGRLLDVRVDVVEPVPRGDGHGAPADGLLVGDTEAQEGVLDEGLAEHGRGFRQEIDGVK